MQNCLKLCVELTIFTCIITSLCYKVPHVNPDDLRQIMTWVACLLACALLFTALAKAARMYVRCAENPPRWIARMLGATEGTTLMARSGSEEAHAIRMHQIGTPTQHDCEIMQNFVYDLLGEMKTLRQRWLDRQRGVWVVVSAPEVCIRARQ